MAAGEKARADSLAAHLAKTQEALAAAQAALAAKEAEIAAAAEAKAEKAEAEDLKLATVGKGEGVEHALIRQLAADPKAYGFEADSTSQKAVKAWAQRRAHQIAILAGYVDVKTGDEVRVRGKGGEITYLLSVDADGKMAVEEYTLGSDGNFKTDPDQTNDLAASYKAAQFQGTGQGPGGMQSYEYLHHRAG